MLLISSCLDNQYLMVNIDLYADECQKITAQEEINTSSLQEEVSKCSSFWRELLRRNCLLSYTRNMRWMLTCTINDHTYKYLTVEEREIGVYFIARDRPCWLYETIISLGSGYQLLLDKRQNEQQFVFTISIFYW